MELKESGYLSKRPQVTVIGSFVQDLCFRTDTFPKVGETKVGKFTTGIGGKGANQSIACNRQGVPTNFITCIGNDSFGYDAEKFFKKENLHYSLSISTDNPSGTASIIVDKDGKNSIVVALGANDDLVVTDRYIETEIKYSKILLCQMENNLLATYAALRIAKDSCLKTILNPAPFNPNFNMDMLKFVDIITPNETEFDSILRKKWGWSTKVTVWDQGYQDVELHDICRKLEVPAVIITLGKKGCFVSTIDQYYRISAIKDINVIDTTGSGDAFSGGLAAGLILYNDSLIKAIEYATVVAGLSTTKYGTSPSMPTGEEVKQYIKHIEEQNAIH